MDIWLCVYIKCSKFKKKLREPTRTQMTLKSFPKEIFKTNKYINKYKAPSKSIKC